jgi:hypothetical protein
MVQEYGKYFGMNTVCFRGGCLTGPNHAGAELHGFLAYLIKCIVTNKHYNVFGYKGKQVRDNIHSWDLVNMFWHYHQNPIPGSVYNAGGGRDNATSILEAIDSVNSILSEINSDHKHWNDFTILEENRIGAHANFKNSRSVGIEIVSIGGLILKDGKYIYGKGSVYKGGSENVVDLGYTYNGYRYYEDISDVQADALTTLLKEIIQRNPEIKVNFTKSYESIYKNVFGLPGIPVKGNKYNTIKPNGGTTGDDSGIFIHATAKGGTHTDTFPSMKMLNVLKNLI